MKIPVRCSSSPHLEWLALPWLRSRPSQLPCSGLLCLYLICLRNAEREYKVPNIKRYEKKIERRGKLNGLIKDAHSPFTNMVALDRKVYGF